MYTAFEKLQSMCQYALTRKTSLPAWAEAKEFSKKEENIVVLCFEIVVVLLLLRLHFL
jgi:hypothetical protein